MTDIKPQDDSAAFFGSTARTARSAEGIRPTTPAVWTRQRHRSHEVQRYQGSLEAAVICGVLASACGFFGLYLGSAVFVLSAISYHIGERILERIGTR